MIDHPHSRALPSHRSILLIASRLIGFQNTIGGTFEIFIQLGAVLAVFALALPTLGGATVVDLLGSLDQIAPGDIARLALGTLVAFMVAWLSIGWLLRFVARHTFVVFGVYRILTGRIILALVAANWL